jgi:hypothetical protein
MKARPELLLAASLAFVTVGCGGETEMDQATQSTEEADPTMAPEGQATGLPAGFALRLDRSSDNAADFHVMEVDGGWHIETGPRAIMYDAANNTITNGDYTLSASFTEIGAPPNHREAFGLIFGGQDLQELGYRYSYFVVRATGDYLIKKRAGGETEELTGGWIASDAVDAAAEDGGDVTNVLQVRVAGDQIHFSVNGTEVTSMPASDLDVYGVAGIRVNHNLNVMVSDWSLTQGM